MVSSLPKKMEAQLLTGKNRKVLWPSSVLVLDLIAHLSVCSLCFTHATVFFLFKHVKLFGPSYFSNFFPPGRRLFQPQGQFASSEWSSFPLVFSKVCVPLILLQALVVVLLSKISLCVTISYVRTSYIYLAHHQNPSTQWHLPQSRYSEHIFE